jgi:hypothetical protein
MSMYRKETKELCLSEAEVQEAMDFVSHMKKCLDQGENWARLEKMEKRRASAATASESFEKVKRIFNWR